MNKYVRTKKFKQDYAKHQNYYEMSPATAKAHSKKHIFAVGTIYLVLLLCVVFYAICIHYNFFGASDWDGLEVQESRQERSQESSQQMALTTEEPAAYIKHVVSPEETLWAISSKYHPNEDTRKVIWTIRAFNPGTDGERMSAKIIPGQVIRVPMDIDAVEEIHEVKEAHSEEMEIELASRHDDRTSNTSQRDDGK